MSVIERAAQEIAVELGFCDRDEWGTDECDNHDRDRALRAAGAALDAVNYEGAVEALANLREVAINGGAMEAGGGYDVTVLRPILGGQ